VVDGGEVVPCSECAGVVGAVDPLEVGEQWLVDRDRVVGAPGGPVGKTEIFASVAPKGILWREVAIGARHGELRNRDESLSAPGVEEVIACAVQKPHRAGAGAQARRECVGGCKGVRKQLLAGWPARR
jgi:hypothetical protein